MLEARNGMAKSTSFENTFPWVRSFSICTKTPAVVNYGIGAGALYQPHASWPVMSIHAQKMGIYTQNLGINSLPISLK
jgi:hypothetical protein